MGSQLGGGRNRRLRDTEVGEYPPVKIKRRGRRGIRRRRRRRRRRRENQ